MNSILIAIKKVLINKNKEKRKFLLAGFLNVILTNIVLQIFLYSNLFNISISTLLSQIINMAFGYFIYSQLIFKVRNSKNFLFIKRYSFLMIILWILNFLGIKAVISTGVSSNTSALIMIPILASFSYIIQKFWVFKQ